VSAGGEAAGAAADEGAGALSPVAGAGAAAVGPGPAATGAGAGGCRGSFRTPNQTITAANAATLRTAMAVRPCRGRIKIRNLRGWHFASCKPFTSP